MAKTKLKTKIPKSAPPPMGRRGTGVLLFSQASDNQRPQDAGAARHQRHIMHTRAAEQSDLVHTPATAGPETRFFDRLQEYLPPLQNSLLVLI